MADSNNSSRVSMAIRVVVILGIAFFAVDEFYLKNKTPELTADEIQAKLAKSKKGKKNREKDAKDKAEKAVQDANKKPEKNSDNKVTENTTEASSSKETPTEPPIENINVTEKSEPVQTESLDQKIDKISENLPVETPEVKPEPKLEPKPEVVEPAPKKEPKMESKSDSSKNTAANQDSNAIEEIKIPSQGKSSENSMASKIVETLIETPPPAYDQLGRGLVYNCKDKYWACVDRAAYLVCNKNLKYNESVGKSKECVTQAIYATDDDCAKIQKYNVSVSQSTDFCKN